MDEFERKVNKIISQRLSSMTNMEAGNHAHNGYDVNQIDPSIGLLGFPVSQVTSATAAPAGTPSPVSPNGTIVFQVDTSPKYALWAYINYNNGGIITGAWKGIQLTL